MIELYKRLLEDPKSARKFIAALVSAVIIAASLGLLGETVGAWTAVFVAFANALGVYVIPNNRNEEEKNG